MVNPKEITESLKFEAKILWWAQVILTPELIKTIVFNKGIPNGSIIIFSNPTGGNSNPILAVGPRQIWK